jgi:hypothetical protein
MTPDVVTLLEAARTDPDVRGILADALQDADGETPAVKAVRNSSRGYCLVCCERCGLPDDGGFWVSWDHLGEWHWVDPDVVAAVGTLRERAGFHEPGGFAKSPKLTLYRSGRWHLVCPHCKRSLVAAKASATRKASEAAVRDAGGLFAGCE